MLHIKVDNTNTGKTVCEGILSEASGKVFTEYIPESRTEEKTFTYKITVTLDSSAGNEYANANLSMGFHWSVVSSDMKEGDGK